MGAEGGGGDSEAVLMRWSLLHEENSLGRVACVRTGQLIRRDPDHWAVLLVPLVHLPVAQPADVVPEVVDPRRSREERPRVFPEGVEEEVVKQLPGYEQQCSLFVARLMSAVDSFLSWFMSAYEILLRESRVGCS